MEKIASQEQDLKMTNESMCPGRSSRRYLTLCEGHTPEQCGRGMEWRHTSQEQP